MTILFKILVVALVFMDTSHALEVNKKAYEKKSDKYFLKYKKEWDKLPEANKKRIKEAYKLGQKHDLGWTLAATMFLENRGQKTTFDNKNSINKNNHGSYVTYDCGAFGINTMTYLRSINKKTKDKQSHLLACKKLANDAKLNASMAIDLYGYALDRYNNSTLASWNYYNTGDGKKLINDRIYEMKGVVRLLNQEM